MNTASDAKSGIITEIIFFIFPENGGSVSVYPGNASLKYELWRNTGEIDTTAGWQVINR